MRIAQISAHTNPLAAPGGRETGGMNVYVRELSAELAHLGYDADIITRLDGPLPRIEQLGPHLRVIRIEAGPPEPLDKSVVATHLPQFADGLLRFAAELPEPYDIVHSHYWQSGWAGGILARAASIPHVVMFHTLGEVKNRARISEQEPAMRIHHERLIVQRADAIVTASDHERGLLERYYGADPAKLATVPCGVDLEHFRPGDRAGARTALGLQADAPVLIWVGRLEKLKGVDILIEALAQLDDPAVTLLIVGGDEHAEGLKAELQAQAAAAGVEPNIRFEGAVAHERLPLYYHAADVCVVPSYYESFGLVAVEAMACGVPVVASRVGGLISTVTDGVTGYLIPWRCPEPFAEKLEVLLYNPELRRNFGRAARRSVERFRWPNVGLRIADVYDTARAARRAHAGAAESPAFGKEVYEAAVLLGNRR
ncbi:glycosyltransferase [bacterium]|jgi:D-inositol-3-phosphate glycosyltransferase|nr:glycosyltransferase [bacterium]